MAVAVARPAPAPRERRMTLDALITGKQKQPVRALLYGPEGVGKSTFGADAPSPIFLAPEDGTGELDVARFPKPETWADVLEAIHTLGSEKHDFRTLVIDTLDHLEPLLWRSVCDDASVKSIEDVGGGFGKGYTAAIDGWRVMLAALERLRAGTSMNVIMLAHSWVRPFRNPDGEDFDRYELKLNAKAAGLLKEWVDAVLFADYETLAAKDPRTKRVKGVSTGVRLIHTVRTAAYDAKNRYNLSESLPLSWSDFAEAIGRGQDAGKLVAAIHEKLVKLPEGTRARAGAALAAAGDDATKLAKLNDRINAELASIEKEEAK